MRARLGAADAGMLQLQQVETAMTDTPEQRVEEAARAIVGMPGLKGYAMDSLLIPIATAALTSSERIIAEQEARIAELESRWDGLAAKIALAMQQQRDQTGLSYAAFAYAEAAMRSVLATPTSSR